MKKVHEKETRQNVQKKTFRAIFKNHLDLTS